MEISESLFIEAVALIDAGEENALNLLLKKYPQLVHDRLPNNEEGYFKDPYLLWFIAENPIRTNRLPSNIVSVTQAIIHFAKDQKVKDFGEQLNYTLALVCSGQVSRECDVQLPLIDLLVDEGADPNEALSPAIAHAEIAAIEQLIQRGAVITLPVAISTHRKNEIKLLSRLAGKSEKQIALAVAAYYGQPDTLSLLIESGVEVNEFCPVGFHSHSTPLHQAVASGSLEAVKVLVTAGADLTWRDRIYAGTPLGWAQHSSHTDIVDYLLGLNN